MENEATIDSDRNGDGDVEDTGEQLVANANASWGTVIPVTAHVPNAGFAPDRVTRLVDQPEELTYREMGNLWLEIPSLGVRMDITGVPLANDGWDVSWLGDHAGWLEGTAFPTSAGNSVLTGHIYMANGKPGPFVSLRTLRWGDQVIVHSYGQQYIYQVRQVLDVLPTNESVFQQEEKPWITLVTCRGYDAETGTYLYRTIVRAVLVRVEDTTGSPAVQK